MLRSPHRRVSFTALVVVSMLPLAAPAEASPPPPPPAGRVVDAPPPVPGKPVAQAGPEAKREKREKRAKRGHGRLSPEERARLEEEVGRKIDTYLTVELSSRLGLSDEKALKLSKLIKERREKKRTRRQEVRAEYQRLQELVDKKASDADLRAQTKRTLDAAQRVDSEQGLFDETARLLTAEEQARLVLAYPHVRREMHRMMREVRGKGRGKLRGERGFEGLDRDF